MKGFEQIPLEGVSFRSTFESDDVPTPKESGFFSMLGSRAVWHKGWKAVSVHPTIAGWGHFEDDRWELYDTTVDPTESHDLAAEHPEKVKEMVDHWFHLADLYHGLPVMDYTAVEVLADPTRPQVAPPRDRYVYYPDTGEVPETAAVNVRNRSSRSPRRSTFRHLRHRVCCSRMARASEATPCTSRTGHSGTSTTSLATRSRWYIHRGDPNRRTRPIGRFEREGTSMPTTGTLSLYVDDKKVGEGQIMTQPGNFSLVGEGLQHRKGRWRTGHRRLFGLTALRLQRRSHPRSHRRRLGRRRTSILRRRRWP